MKILILNNEYPPLGGGAGVCTKYEAQGLVARGHEVTVLTAWFEGEKEVEKQGNLRIIRLKSLRKYEFKSNVIEMLSWAKHAKNFLNNHLNNETYDVVVANYALPSGMVAKNVYEKFNIPYIVISHGHDIPFIFPKQMMKYHLVTYFWLKSIFESAAKTVLLTKEMKAAADKFLGKNKAQNNVIIPNGCYIEAFMPNFSIKKEDFTIIFVGRLVEQKDPMTFLKALPILKEKNLKFQVNILGDGPLRSKMENFVAENNLSENVTFKGWVTKDEMIRQYQSANLQVISSIAEAMSIAALESLSSGQYVISTPVSGNTDLIKAGINGEFIDYGDFSDLAIKIETYHNEKFAEKYHVPHQYLQAFRKKYSWKGICETYENLLEEVIETSKNEDSSSNENETVAEKAAFEYA